MKPDCCFLAHDLVIALIPVLVAVIGASFAYRNYLKQREYELVRKRYLDEGIDLFIGNIENALSVFRQNWFLALSLLKRYRDIDTEFDETSLSAFLPLDHSGMNVLPARRLHMLIDVDAGWIGIQKIFAFVDAANSFFQHELAVALRALSTGRLHLSFPKSEAVKLLHEKLVALDTQSHEHYEFLSEVLRLVGILEREKFTFRSISKFHRRKDVRSVVADLKALLGSDLEAQEGHVAATSPSPTTFSAEDLSVTTPDQRGHDAE